VWIVMIGATVSYFRWNARFTLPGFTLAAMTWGLALRERWLALAATSAASVTLLVSFVHFFEKPAGIRLLEPRSARSAFTTDRPSAMAWDDRVVPLLAYLEYSLPRDAEIASFPVFYPRRPDLQPPTAPELLTYVLFGRTLSRRVFLARDARSATRTPAQWYLSPTRRLTGCVVGWETVAHRSNWSILRRSPATNCEPG
jgi:hypothetical protein